MSAFFSSFVSLYFTAFFYLFAGLYHFINPDFYIKMMPSWFAEKYLLNALAGITEIILALALLIPKLRNWGVYGIVTLLISFFSVHINHFFEPPLLQLGNYQVDFSQTPIYYGLFLRLSLHFFLLWWIWQLRKQTNF